METRFISRPLRISISFFPHTGQMTREVLGLEFFLACPAPADDRRVFHVQPRIFGHRPFFHHLEREFQRIRNDAGQPADPDVDPSIRVGVMCLRAIERHLQNILHKSGFVHSVKPNYLFGFVGAISCLILSYRIYVP